MPVSGSWTNSRYGGCSLPARRDRSAPPSGRCSGRSRRVLDVVAGELVALHLEQVLGVAQVADELRRHLVAVEHGAREGVAPRGQHRVGVVPGVELHRAVVGVDGGLDGVAHVVDLVGRHDRDVVGLAERVVGHGLERLALRQRVAVGGGVAVDDPQDPAVDHRRVGVGVDGEPRRDLLHPVPRAADVEHLAVGVDPLGEQEVGVAELDGVEQLAEERADLDTALAVVRRRGLLLALGVAAEVELDVRRAGQLADDRVVGAVLAVVDPVLVAAGRRREGVLVGLLALGPLDVGVLGGVAGRPLVGEGRDDAVAVGVDGVQVGPVAGVVGSPLWSSSRTPSTSARSVPSNW